MISDSLKQLVEDTDYGTDTPTWAVSGKRVLYEADCMLLNRGTATVYDIKDMVPGTEAYCQQLVTYRERFGTHMPIGLRKHLLTELLA